MKKKHLDKTDKPMKFILKGIEIEKYFISTPNTPFLTPTATVVIEMALQQKFSEKDNLVINACTINLFDNEKKENHYCSLTVNIGFTVENLSDYIETSTTPPIGKNIKLTCLNTLNAITISTVRGILYVKNMGTFLHNSLLPIMDATKHVTMSAAQIEEKMKIK